MRRCLTQVLVTAGALSLSLPALADEPRKNCPPGAWFCAEADVTVNPQLPRVAPQQPAPPVQPAPPARPQAPPPAEIIEEPEAPAAPPPPPVRRRPPAVPPMVIYEQVPTAPPQVIIVTPGYGYGRYARPMPPPPPPRIKRPAATWKPEFGINLRVEGATLGRSTNTGFNAGLGGVGMSLRYRPVPHFAFDLGADVLMGTDYNGFNRTEVPISLSGMLFVNPRSRAQFYLTAGGHVSRAQIRSDVPAPRLLAPVEDGSQWGATYTYLGGQGGGGFEFRLSKRVALDIDVVGFIRKRIDDGQKPEFFDPSTGRTTNVSGGALFRGGVNFWW